MLDELDQFLRNYNFIRTNTKPSINKPQGDALYIRTDDSENLVSILFKLKSKIQISKIYMFLNLLKNRKKVIYLTKKIYKKNTEYLINYYFPLKLFRVFSEKLNKNS